MIGNRMQYKVVYKAASWVYGLAEVKDIENKCFQSHHLFLFAHKTILELEY